LFDEVGLVADEADIEHRGETLAGVGGLSRTAESKPWQGRAGGELIIPTSSEACRELAKDSEFGAPPLGGT
jgi:hypothetical protein